MRAAACLLSLLGFGQTRGQAAPPPPALSGISAVDAAASGAVIVWTTDQPSDSEVEYGLTTAYGNSAFVNSPPATGHRAALAGLAAGALYHYRVKSRSAEGSSAVSDDLTFSTVSPLPPVALPTTALPTAAPPTVLIMNPAEGAIVSSGVLVSANAVARAGIASVQFLLDDRQLGEPLAAAPYTFTWSTALSADGAHALAAAARDAAGNVSTSAVVSVTVDNVPPVISEVSVSAISASGAALLWTTNKRSDSQAEYGVTAAYGGAVPLNSSLVTRRGMMLTGLAPGTAYHFRVKSRDAAGNLSTSEDFTFATAGAAGGLPPAAIAAGASAADDPQAKAPQKFLNPALPNGANAAAVFGPAAREVTIVDVRGALVFHASSAAAAIVWNCRDASGRVVPSGVYVANILTKDSKRIYQSFAVVK